MNKLIASLVVTSFLFMGASLFHADSASAKTHKKPASTTTSKKGMSKPTPTPAPSAK